MITLRNTVNGPMEIKTKAGVEIIPALGSITVDVDADYLELLRVCGVVEIEERRGPGRPRKPQ